MCMKRLFALRTPLVLQRDRRKPMTPLVCSTNFHEFQLETPFFLPPGPKGNLADICHVLGCGEKHTGTLKHIKIVGFLFPPPPLHSSFFPEERRLPIPKTDQKSRLHVNSINEHEFIPLSEPLFTVRKLPYPESGNHQLHSQLLQLALKNGLVRRQKDKSILCGKKHKTRPTHERSPQHLRRCPAVCSSSRSVFSFGQKKKQHLTLPAMIYPGPSRFTWDIS